jgi:predicted nuclease of predicted toxin-antitoxin system
LNFLIDMPVTSRAVSRLIAAGHQAVHAASIGLASARDAEILAVARAGRQIIVTADLDYPRLLAIHRAAAPGVILFRGGSYTDDEMLRLWIASWLNRIRSTSSIRSLSWTGRACAGTGFLSTNDLAVTGLQPAGTVRCKRLTTPSTSPSFPEVRPGSGG